MDRDRLPIEFSPGWMPEEKKAFEASMAKHQYRPEWTPEEIQALETAMAKREMDFMTGKDRAEAAKQKTMREAALKGLLHGSNFPTTLAQTAVINAAMNQSLVYQTVTPGMWSDAAVSALRAENAELRRMLAATLSATSDDKRVDRVGPSDEAHEDVRKTMEHIVNGRVTKPARDALRGAIDSAPEDKRAFPLNRMDMTDRRRVGG